MVPGAGSLLGLKQPQSAPVNAGVFIRRAHHIQVQPHPQAATATITSH